MEACVAANDLARNELPRLSFGHEFRVIAEASDEVEISYTVSTLKMAVGGLDPAGWRGCKQT